MPTKSLRLGRWIAAPLLVMFAGLANAALTVVPITWDIIGLDSNSPATGPHLFPVGARVCTDAPTGDLNVDFVWDSANPYIDLRAGTAGSLVLAPLAASECADAYFEIDVAQDAAAFETTRRYHIAATDSADTQITATTPTPRQLFVEHLISQNRNAVTGIEYGPDAGSLTAVPFGGAMNMVIGNTYVVKLYGGTATQGYNQFESFINFPNTLFRVLAVSTDYSANNSPYVSTIDHDRLYADACLWDSDPDSPNYASCIGGDYKSGGSTVVMTYTVEVIATSGASDTLNTLLYDFSGSSFHYNSDFSSSTVTVSVADPASAGIDKQFVPDSIIEGGASTLRLTLVNPNPSTLNGVSFADPLPGGTAVAALPNAATSGCGTPNFSPSASDTSLAFTGGSIAPNSSCIVEVDVTAASVGDYDNTTGNLFIDGSGSVGSGVDTGNNASATLRVVSGTPPATCAPADRVTLARWTVPSTATEPPDAAGAPTIQSAAVGTANASSLITPVQATISSTTGTNDSYSWSSYGYGSEGQALDFVVDTHLFTDVEMELSATGNVNGPTTLTVAYDAGSGLTLKGNFDSGTTPTYDNDDVWHPLTLDFSGQTNTGGNTTFRVSGSGASNDNSGANLFLDDIRFTGCSQAQTPPALSKAFAPDSLPVGSVSTLTFQIGNQLPDNVNLTEVSFSDPLPGGLQVAPVPNAATDCTGASFLPGAGDTTLNFSGASLAANATCSASVDVVATLAGRFDNVSGYISSAESGSNTTANGYGTDSLTAIAAPLLQKAFDRSPILTTQTATLNFLISNPNQSEGLLGIAFSDVLPTGLTVANSGPTPACGGNLTTTAPHSIAFSGGNLGAAASCSFGVTVTGFAAGTQVNVTGNITSSNGGTGNQATATVAVKDPSPGLTLLKQVSLDGNGPWVNYLALAAGTQVYYRFQVENTGDVAFTSFSVSDPALAGTSADPAGCSWQTSNTPSSLPGLPVAGPTLDPVATCVVGPVTTTSGETVNTASPVGTHATGSYQGEDYSATYATTGLTLAKSVTESVYSQADDLLHYSYLVANSGAAILSGPVTVSDDKTSVNCPALSSVGNGDAYFDPGEQITCTATYTVLAGDVTAGSVTNIASASAGGVSSPTDSATVPIASTALSLVKSATENHFVQPGDLLHYSYLVTNTGTLPLAGPVTVTDDKTTVDCPAVTTVGNGDGNLDSGEQLTCSAEYTVLDADVTAGQVINVASASAGGTSSPDDSVTVFQLTAVPQPVPGLNALGVIMLTFLVFVLTMGVQYRQPGV
jgi:hypothetical protein